MFGHFDIPVAMPLQALLSFKPPLNGISNFVSKHVCGVARYLYCIVQAGNSLRMARGNAYSLSTVYSRYAYINIYRYLEKKYMGGLDGDFRSYACEALCLVPIVWLLTTFAFHFLY